MAESNLLQSRTYSLMETSSQALEDSAVQPLQGQNFENNSPKFEESFQIHEISHPDSNTKKHGTVLPSTFRQLRWELLLCLGMIPISILLFLYVYASLISNNPPLGPFLFSPSRTLLVITILSQGLANLFLMLFSNVFEALRWHFASRKKGVLATTFLGLSPATSSFGVLKLLYASDICHHTWWCIQRLLLPVVCILVGVILKGDITFNTVYNPTETRPALAGLAPISIPVLARLPIAMGCLFFSTYSNAILGSSNFVTGIEPVACSGNDCKAVFLPGSLQLARDLGSFNGSQVNLNKTLFNNAPAVLIHNAPGYQLDYYPIDENYKFNTTQDCATFGQARGQGLYICLAMNNSTIVAGWSVCPSSVFQYGECFSNTSWTDTLDQSTSLSIFKRYSTTAYDGRNLTILSLESISDPQTTDITADQLRPIFTAVLTPDFNLTSDNTETVNALLYSLGFALRLYQDEFTGDSQLPLLLLQGFLAVPIQFATMAWERTNATSNSNGSEFALPPDLETTASLVEVTYRAKAKPWTVCVFMLLTAILLIWCNSILLWILAQRTAAPNLSAFVEVDIGSKSTFSSICSQNAGTDHLITGSVEDWSTMLKRAGLGNAGTTSVVQSLKDKRLRVAGIDLERDEKNLVLVTGKETGGDLCTEGLNSLKRGTVYI